MDSSQYSISSEWDIVSSESQSGDEGTPKSNVEDLTTSDGFNVLENPPMPIGSGVENVPHDPEEAIHNDSSSDIDVIEETPDTNQCDVPIQLVSYSLSSSLEGSALISDVYNPTSPPVAANLPEVNVVPAEVLPSVEVDAPLVSSPATVSTTLPADVTASPPVAVESPPSEVVESPPPAAVEPSPPVAAAVAPLAEAVAAPPVPPAAPVPRFERFFQLFEIFDHPYLQGFRTPEVQIMFRIFGFCLLYILMTTKYPPAVEEMQEQLISLKTENEDLKNQVLSKIEDDKLFIALEDQIKALKSENLKLSNHLKSLILKLEEQTTIFQKENSQREKEPYKNEIDRLKEQMNTLQIDNDELQKQLVRMRYGAYSPYEKEAEPEAREKVKDEGIENVSEVLSEEIMELRKKLHSEVEKLKEWKESVQELMKRLISAQEGSDRTGSRDHSGEDEKFKKSSRKDRRFHERMWKALKSNFKDTLDSLPNIELPNVISKYADQKKVKAVFESVNHYFGKAQEKTRKLFGYKEDVRNGFWDVLGDLRKKWGDLKNDFFERHYGKGEASDQCTNKASFSSDRPARSHYFESDRQFKHRGDDGRGETGNPQGSPDFEDGRESWQFDRAAHRSEARASEQEEEESSNWFLRKKAHPV